MQANIKFDPTDADTLRLLVETYDELGDPVDVFNRLMSAAVMAGAFLDVMPAQAAQMAGVFTAAATRAIAERPDIFGRAGRPN